VETSIGYIRQEFPSSLVYGNSWMSTSPLHRSGALIALAAIVFTFPPYVHWCFHLAWILFYLGVAISTMVVIRHRQSWVIPTMLCTLRDYRRQLNRKQWVVQRVERGPGRALSVGKLVHMHEAFIQHIRSRHMSYVCSDIVKPLTKAAGCSFAEYVGPDAVQWFVSDYWGSPFKDFVDAVVAHARALAPSCLPAIQGEEAWKAVAYWICTFSINQWDAKSEVSREDYLRSSFYLALRSPGCRGTVMVMDPQVGPLTRSWCLFELLQTFELQRENPAYEFRLATGQGLLGLGSLPGGATDVDLARRIGEAVATLDLKDAKATEREDKEMIDALVQQSGGFDLMNRFIRTKIQEVLQALRSDTENSFLRLDMFLASLTSSGSDVGQSAAVVPRTGPRPTLLGAAHAAIESTTFPARPSMVGSGDAASCSSAPPLGLLPTLLAGHPRLGLAAKPSRPAFRPALAGAGAIGFEVDESAAAGPPACADADSASSRDGAVSPT